MSDAKPVNNLQITAEITVPASNGEEHDSVQEAGSNHGRVLKILPWQELDGSEETLPGVENGEKQGTKNDAGDDVRGVPSLRSVVYQAEG